MKIVFTLTPGLAFSNASTAALAGPWPAAASVSTWPAEAAVVELPPEVEQAATAVARQQTDANVFIDFMTDSRRESWGD